MSLIVIIQNVSALAPVSDYRYQVLVGDGTPDRSTLLAQGQILGHTRDDGYKALLHQLLDLLDEETPINS